MSTPKTFYIISDVQTMIDSANAASIQGFAAGYMSTHEQIQAVNGKVFFVMAWRAKKPSDTAAKVYRYTNDPDEYRGGFLFRQAGWSAALVLTDGRKYFIGERFS